MMELLLISALISAVGMALLTIWCLFTSRDRNQRWLALWVGLFLGALGLLAPGSWTLNLLGLAWRSTALYTLGLLLAGSGLAVLVCTVRCFQAQIRGRGDSQSGDGVLIVIARAACGLIIVVSVWLGPLMLVLAADSDRTVIWEGQKAVEVNTTWMDPSFDYYAYHGPIVRGSGRLGHSTHPVE